MERVVLKLTLGVLITISLFFISHTVYNNSGGNGLSSESIKASQDSISRPSNQNDSSTVAVKSQSEEDTSTKSVTTLERLETGKPQTTTTTQINPTTLSTTSTNKSVAEKKTATSTNTSSSQRQQTPTSTRTEPSRVTTTSTAATTTAPKTTATPIQVVNLPYNPHCDETPDEGTDDAFINALLWNCYLRSYDLGQVPQTEFDNLKEIAASRGRDHLIKEVIMKSTEFACLIGSGSCDSIDLTPPISTNKRGSCANVNDYKFANTENASSIRVDHACNR